MDEAKARRDLQCYVTAINMYGSLFAPVHNGFRPPTKTVSVGGIRLHRMRLQAAICTAKTAPDFVDLPPRAEPLRQLLLEAVRNG